MSITKPSVDTLLKKTENNPFLLCSIASKRASDLSNMIRGQHLRVTALQDFDDVTNIISGKDMVSIAMDEIMDDTLTYNAEKFDQQIKDEDTNN